MKIEFLFVLVALVVSQAGKADVPDTLFLTVYYESDCPDSKRFIVRQLKPAVRLLQDNLIVRLVPFGKARSINNGTGGFECQHGPPECLGNIIQDCTLDFMTQRTDVERVDYVACEMQSRASTRGDWKCVAKANVPSQLVHQCATSDRGTVLQLDSEYLTGLVNHRFIPTITVNDVFNQVTQNNAQEDLIGVLCSMLENNKSCENYYNDQALEYVIL